VMESYWTATVVVSSLSAGMAVFLLAIVLAVALATRGRRLGGVASAFGGAPGVMLAAFALLVPQIAVHAAWRQARDIVERATSVTSGDPLREVVAWGVETVADAAVVAGWGSLALLLPCAVLTGLAVSVRLRRAGWRRG